MESSGRTEVPGFVPLGGDSSRKEDASPLEGGTGCFEERQAACWRGLSSDAGAATSSHRTAPASLAPLRKGVVPVPETSREGRAAGQGPITTSASRLPSSSSSATVYWHSCGTFCTEHTQRDCRLCPALTEAPQRLCDGRSPTFQTRSWRSRRQAGSPVLAPSLQSTPPGQLLGTAGLRVLECTGHS